MQQVELAPGDLSALAAIRRTLEARVGQYDHGLVQGLFIREADGTWRNGISRVTANREAPTEAAHWLDYGDVLYAQWRLDPHELAGLIERCYLQGVISIDTFVARTSALQANMAAIHTQLSRHVNSRDRHIKSEWPATLYQYQGHFERRGFPHDHLLRPGLPLYPDAHHLVRHMFDLDLQEANALVGSVLILLPDFRARIGDLRIATTRLSAQVEAALATEDQLFVKVFASNGADTYHADVGLAEVASGLELGLLPTDVELCLLHGEKRMASMSCQSVPTT